MREEGWGQPPRYLRPRQAVGAPQLLDAALQQLRRPPEAGREGMQLLQGGSTGVSGAGRLCGQWDGSRGCREEAEVQKEEEQHY